LYDGKKFPGNNEVILECPVHRLPVFVKGGAIVPMKPVKQNTKEISETLILHVYLGSHDSSFEFYDDDGSTYEYQNNQYAKRRLELRVAEQKIILNKTQGNFQSHYKIVKMVLHGLYSQLNEVKINGTAAGLSREINQFFGPLEKFDPIYEPEPAPFEEVYAVEFNYSSEYIEVQW
jgi:alpha-glucosidase